MASSRIALSASQAVVADASAELAALGSAVDAVAGAVYLAAAASPTVLLGPVQLLLGGGGVGLLAVDGRLRQPGKGGARPRGFVPEESVPPGAYLAVPMLPAALGATLALASATSLARVLGPALSHARRVAKGRAQVLERLARRGPRAMAEGPIAEALLSAGGRMAGGTLHDEDLAASRPAVVPCAIEGEGHRRIAHAPWRKGGEERFAASHDTHVVAAVDGRGRVAIACYEAVPLDEAVPVGQELHAPRAAAPVLRGETRVRPGEPRNVGCPLALFEVDDVLQAAGGGAGIAMLVTRFLEGHALEGGRTDAQRVTGVLRTRDGGRAL